MRKIKLKFIEKYNIGLFYFFCLLTFDLNANDFNIYLEPNCHYCLTDSNFKYSENYNYFSKLLIYPLSVSKIINMENGGNERFKVEIFDSKMKLILVLTSSPFCSTKLNIDSFDAGLYIMKVSTESVVHQFYFQKV